MSFLISLNVSLFFFLFWIFIYSVVEWGAICHALERCMEWREKILGNYNKRGPQQPDSGRFFCGWLKRFVLRRFFFFFFFFSAEHIFFLFFLNIFSSDSFPARSRMDEFTHHARQWIMEVESGPAQQAEITCCRTHSIYLFSWAFFLFFFFLSVRRAGVGTSASSQVHCLTSTRWVVLIGLGTLATTPFNAQLIDPLFGVTGGTVSDKNWNKS